LAKLGRVKLLSGRLPDLRSTSEVAIGYDPTLDRKAPIGSTIQIAFLRASVGPAAFFGNGSLPQKDFLPPFRVRVVGVVLSQSELTGELDVSLTPAIRETYGRG